MSDRGLSIFDVAGAITPTLVATMTLRAPRNAALRDGFGYIADADDGLRAIDVRDPSRPRLTAGPSTRGSAISVSVTDRHILVATSLASEPNHGGVSVFDRSDPARSQLLGTVPLPESPTSVAAGERWACALFRSEDRWSGMWLRQEVSGAYLINLDDPTSPVVVDWTLLSGTAYGATAVGDRVYVSMYDGGFHVLDVTTYRRRPLHLPNVMAAEPQLVDRVTTHDRAMAGNNE